jgi:gas vesicle protein
MKVFRFLLGLAIGAGVALLFAPKSGRELRQQLSGTAGGKLLGSGSDVYQQPEPAEWGGATAVAEAPVVVEESAWTAEPVIEEVVVAEVVEEAAEPAGDEQASEDLRQRIEETRAALEDELAQPFAAEADEIADGRAAVADAAFAYAAGAELLA